MKKIFTLVVEAVMALADNAKDYTGNLSVTMSGTPLGTQETKISVTEQGDGKYTLALNNFKLDLIGGVGNIVLTDVEGVVDNTGNGKTFLATDQVIQITKGDDPSVDTWIGPNLKDVPVSVKADMTESNLYAVIKIESFGGIDVVFGDGGYQLPNSGFEYFHKATSGDKTSDEPNAWHSFMSCTGNLAMFVSGVPHTFISDEKRPNSTGAKSVKITSGLVLGSIPANGTMTTGQMQAGEMDAADPGNCAFLDFENEKVDGNGDPFYTVLNGKPDALTVWVKFKQGQDLGENKYATVSAVITDGTYYQDPEDPEETYKNVVAKAQNKTIESKDFAWQQLTIPFDYDTYASNNAEVKALLVTISTNAQPGVGSKSEDYPDELYVDDIALVYNAGLESLKIKGTDVALEEEKTDYEVNGLSGELSLDDVVAVSDGRGAMVTKTIEAVDGGALVTVKVTSNDYQKVNTWTVNVKGVSTGIDKVETTTENGVQAIYTIDGRQVSTMDAKGIYIVRKADGTTVKVLKK